MRREGEVKISDPTPALHFLEQLSDPGREKCIAALEKAWYSLWAGLHLQVEELCSSSVFLCQAVLQGTIPAHKKLETLSSF